VVESHDRLVVHLKRALERGDRDLAVHFTGVGP
jgi:hypothetical protein